MSNQRKKTGKRLTKNRLNLHLFFLQMIKTSFVSPEMPKARTNKTGFIMIVQLHLYIRRELDIIRYDTYFLVWQRTVSIPPDINRFRGHTGIVISRIVL